MKVFIIGITGAVGELLAQELQTRDVTVGGLVRTSEQAARLSSRGFAIVARSLQDMTVDDLVADIVGYDALVYSAGSNGGAREVTKAIDGDGVAKALAAARTAGISRFALVSVLPESWRERELGEEVEYYFAVKKEADVAVAGSGLDWIILRPSLLLDEPGKGTVSLGPAELHGNISREDVAETLAEILLERRIGQQILELNTGPTPIREAVQLNVRD